MKPQLKVYQNFPLVKTKNWRKSLNMKTKCEDFILEFDDPIVNFLMVRLQNLMNE